MQDKNEIFALFLFALRETGLGSRITLADTSNFTNQAQTKTAHPIYFVPNDFPKGVGGAYMFLDKGTAPDDVIEEIYDALSEMHVMMGGAPLKFVECPLRESQVYLKSSPSGLNGPQ